MDIKYVAQILNGKVKLSDQDELLLYASDKELAELVAMLIADDYVFTDSPAGWPPAAVVQDLNTRGLLNQAFTAIAWRAPGEYRTYEVA